MILKRKHKEFTSHVVNTSLKLLACSIRLYFYKLSKTARSLILKCLQCKFIHRLLCTFKQVNYKMRMNIRRMAQGERKHHKRSKRLNKVRWNYSSLCKFIEINLNYLLSPRMEAKTTCHSPNSSKTDLPNSLRTVRIICRYAKNLNKIIIRVIRNIVD